LIPVSGQLFRSGPPDDRASCRCCSSSARTRDAFTHVVPPRERHARTCGRALTRARARTCTLTQRYTEIHSTGRTARRALGSPKLDTPLVARGTSRDVRAMTMTKSDDDDDDDDDAVNFFPAESAPLTAQGQPAGSARGTFTRWVLSRTRRWLLFLSLILSRARLFYPANLFKRTFNSAWPRVVGMHAGIRASGPPNLSGRRRRWTMLANNRSSGRPADLAASGSSFSDTSSSAVSALRLSRRLLERARAFSTPIDLFLVHAVTRRRSRGRTPALRARNPRPPPPPPPPPAVFPHTVVAPRRAPFLHLLLSLPVPICLSLSPLSSSLPRLPFRPSVSFLFCVL